MGYSDKHNCKGMRRPYSIRTILSPCNSTYVWIIFKCGGESMKQTMWTEVERML